MFLTDEDLEDMFQIEQKKMAAVKAAERDATLDVCRSKREVITIKTYIKNREVSNE
jgi:hypothetical protein